MNNYYVLIKYVKLLFYLNNLKSAELKSKCPDKNK